MTPEIAQAAVRAAAWLQAHPDQHITGEVAQTRTGESCSVLDPKACCFCAIGRLAFELGIEAVEDGSYTPLNRLIGSDTVTHIFTTNDSRGRAAGIAALEELAND